MDDFVKAAVDWFHLDPFCLDHFFSDNVAFGHLFHRIGRRLDQLARRRSTAELDSRCLLWRGNWTVLLLAGHRVLVCLNRAV